MEIDKKCKGWKRASKHLKSIHSSIPGRKPDFTIKIEMFLFFVGCVF